MKSQSHRLTEPSYTLGDTLHTCVADSEFGSLWILTNQDDDITGYQVIQNVRNTFIDGTIEYDYPTGELWSTHCRYYETLDQALTMFNKLIKTFITDIDKIYTD